MAASVGIGLDISEDQIRAVRLRRTRRGIILERLGSAPTPEGAVTGGIVREHRLLADSIRRLLRTYDIGGTHVVVGLSGRAAVSRSIELPAVRDEELRTVVAGEMEHYRMVPAGQGTFDFLRLEDTDSEQSRTRLLVMAAEKNVVERYRDALRLAGRQMVALEPALPAACRAAYSCVSEGGVALIAVGARTTDLAVFHDGALRYSRQIDMGTLDLLGNEPTGEPDLAPIQASDEEPQEEETRPVGSGSAEADLGSLVYEIQRSLEFYHRETSGGARVERLVLVGNINELADLADYLASSLGLPASICHPFEGMSYRNPSFDSQQLAHIGPSFAPAAGLALHAIGEIPEVPYLDLSDTGAEGRFAKAAPKWLAGSLGISIVLVVVALMASLIIGRSLRARQDALAKAKAELARVAQIEEERASAARRAREAITLVELRGLPWSDILFQVSEFVPSGVWVTRLSADSGNTLSLEGRALSAEAVAALMDSLTRSRLFAMPRMTSIRKRAGAKRSLLTYKINVRVVQRGLARGQAPLSAAPAGEPR